MVFWKPAVNSSSVCNFYEDIVIHTFFIFPDVKKLIECNKDRHCPKTLPKCHKMDRPTSSGKKGYCVFRTCQYCQKERNCPTLGNVCTSGSLSGKCNAYSNTCEYDPVLAIANCVPFPGKVKTALVQYLYRYMYQNIEISFDSRNITMLILI